MNIRILAHDILENLNPTLKLCSLRHRKRKIVVIFTTMYFQYTFKDLEMLREKKDCK